MSSTDVALEKQKRRHKGPLVGMAACGVFVGAILFAYLVWIVEPVEEEATTETPAVDASN